MPTGNVINHVVAVLAIKFEKAAFSFWITIDKYISVDNAGYLAISRCE